MKINTEIEPLPAQEQVTQAEVKKQVRHLGTINPHNGHTLYEYEVATKEIREAEFTKQDLNFPLKLGEKASVNKKVVVKEGCVYIPALNKANALRKLQKGDRLIQALYNANFDLINDYLAAAVSVWLDYASEERDQQKQQEMLNEINEQWYEWIYKLNADLFHHYHHLFLSRWTTAIDYINKSSIAQDGEQTI